MRYKISIGVDAIAMMALAVRCIALPSGTSSISRASLNTSHATNSTRAAGESLPQPALLATQDECGTAEVVAGDSCESVAKKCDASPEELLQYNPSEDFCATLEIGQIVCCSPGNLPELGPRPQADGTCASHTVAPLEPCDTIARDNHITVQDIEAYNHNTWRFMGCDNLQAGQIICLSLGAAPMPATDPNAICGPQVNGTRKPMDVDADLAQLNPCPLNACCNNWGQCGNTEEFCTVNDSPFLGPGAPVPGGTSCISNCGMDIIKGDPVAEPFTIGYFEGFAADRSCLVLEPIQIPTDKFTHLHFAFANITADFRVELHGEQARRWNEFASLSGPKRIISFGGWEFSTAEDTYSTFSQAVSPGNRDIFIENLVQFVVNEEIDGVDFDWEYPGIAASEGIHAGHANDGVHFQYFLASLRQAFDKLGGKSISVAVPAEYWILKNYRIRDMAEKLDYIVFMAYDMHGQWDFGNLNSVSGCKNGDCLRSHINLTETNSALSMITKAGVPAGKVVVGVSSYGRSYKMSQPGCTDPMCTYTGPDSGATAGECTQTAGILANAEIYDILASDETAMTYYDTSSNSDIMVYGDDQWVSFMSETTKSSRHDFYVSQGFLGTVDWAIDLAEDGANEVFPEHPDCNQGMNYNTIDDVINDDDIPDLCINTYVLAALAKELQTSLDKYTAIMDDDYNDKYKAFKRMMHHQAPVAWGKFHEEELDNYFTCFYEHKKVNHTGGCTISTMPSEFRHKNKVNIYRIVNDQQAFCEKLSSDYGLNCDWLESSSHKYSRCCTKTTCLCHGRIYEPTIIEDFDVYDPGEQIRNSLEKYTGLAKWLYSSARLAGLGMYPGFVVDAVDASSMLVYTAQSAVDAMERVVDLGEKEEKQEEEQRKQLIIAFVTGFLFVLPGVGWLAEAAEFAALARMITLTGEVGNAAMTLYDIVEDPESAPMAIASTLFGGVALKDLAAVGRAAKASRVMGRDSLKALGDDVVSKVDRVQSIRNVCRI